MYCQEHFHNLLTFNNNSDRITCALPEVGGDAAVYVDPEDIEAMSFALTQCLLIPEGVREIRELGLERAAEFSWTRTAKETFQVIEGVVKL